jgi:hypothetical protein
MRPWSKKYSGDPKRQIQIDMANLELATGGLYSSALCGLIYTPVADAIIRNAQIAITKNR